MSAPLSNASSLELSFETPRRRHRPELRRALRALRRLLDEPDETQMAFEIGYALDGDAFAGELAKMVACPAGREVFRERPVLLDALSDRAALLAMPEGSFGRAYLDHIDRFGLVPDKLIQLRRETDAAHSARDEDLRWFVERGDLSHDLWHVLSGYGADSLGEGALLAFSLAQRYSRSGLLLTLGASSKIVRFVGPGWLGSVWRAWRRGRGAVHLSALPYERMLPLPLESVRRAAGIAPAGPLPELPPGALAS